MLYKVITKFHFLKTNEQMNKGKQISGDIRITNSVRLLQREFGMPVFINMIGILEYHDLLESVYLYAIGGISLDLNDKERIKYLNRYIDTALLFSNALWFVKDNSVATENCFLYIENEEGPSVTSNSRTAYFCDARGENQTTLFSNEELQQAIEFYTALVSEKSFEWDTRESYEYLHNESSRVERFFYYLQAARAQNNLPGKISLYCTMFEILLSTDSIEITHKIAERAARFIGKDLDERILIYKKVKDAYTVRSSTVHGDKLRKAFRAREKLQEISVDIDDILRRLIVKIISNKDHHERFHKHSHEMLNEWFLELSLN